MAAANPPSSRRTSGRCDGITHRAWAKGKLSQGTRIDSGHRAIGARASNYLSRRPRGVSFSAFPGAVLVILQRGWLVATLIWVIVSPCLSYLLHGLLGTSFQSVQPVLPLTDHVPCNMPRPADM